MVNERDEKYEIHDESEYHFSDDESTYELEPEIEAESDAPRPSPAASVKANTLSGLKRYRRMIIGVVVFVVLMVVVYKLIIPSTPVVSPEFADTVNKTAKPKVKPIVQQTQTAPQPTVSSTQAAMPAQQSNPMLASTAPPPAQAPAAAVSPALPEAPASAAPLQPIATPAPVAAPPTAQPVVTVVPSSASSDQLSALEQQTTKLTNLVESEYAQKLADSQAQNVAMQAKIRELNTRLANMEATLNQLTQAILNKPITPSSSRVMPAAGYQPSPTAGKASEPKMAYTVQAIIPGRAWLKSDGGDTVTVAEGDILKDYGRITKIDPYDGVVEIDTGSKTITLSYGSGGE